MDFSSALFVVVVGGAIAALIFGTSADRKSVLVAAASIITVGLVALGLALTA